MSSENKRIRIVLIGTSHPGNIGAAARAMKTMCLHELVLVNPLQYPHADATSRASGADDVLAKAQLYSNLDDALADCTLIMGASARKRRLAWPILNPRESAEMIMQRYQNHKVAIVFGREHSGLTNEELARCHYLINIPSNDNFSSLNIAAAVQIITYELNMASLLVGDGMVSEYQEPPADARDMEGFYQHLNDTLVQIKFINPDYPRKMMRRLRRLFNRAQPNKVEMNILRGILTAIQRR